MRSLKLLALFLIPCLFACHDSQEDALFGYSPSPASGQEKGEAKPQATDILFQSTDGGQTWQDRSAGLPLDLKPVRFFAVEDQLYLRAEESLFKTSAASKPALWEKQAPTDQQFTNILACPGGLMAISDPNHIFQQMNGTDVWMPVFPNLETRYVSTVFTAKDGSIFIGAETRWNRGEGGIFKSTDQGKTWKYVMRDGWVMEIVESDGVLLCTNQGGVMRSADGGETWEKVLSKGGVGIDVSVIKDGFAAIVYEHGSETRRILTSKDGGKTWQPIDAGLPPSKLVSSIVQMDDSFYCGHPDGIYRSDDQGKTWQLVVPTIGKKVFNLSVSEGVMYALLREGGC